MNGFDLSYSRVFAIDQPEQSSVPDMSPSEVDYFRYRVTLYHESRFRKSLVLERRDKGRRADKISMRRKIQLGKRFNRIEGILVE